MAYYILYPKNKSLKVKIVNKRPRASPKYGFAEGSFGTKKAVSIRLNWMDIPLSRRPRGY